ncbi:MAG TPA: sigma-70 family RNA polymerase sigma factor, partial [Bacteroidales bacterium]|nr:sigma-70 family RNA polymerase sigma factor [Bacteroidales bacterium]
MSEYKFQQDIIALESALRNFAFSLTLNQDDADDLLQDTFLKALLYKDKFEDDTNLKAWLYTIMRNTFINNYRRKTKSNSLIQQTEDMNYLRNMISNRSDNA